MKPKPKPEESRAGKRAPGQTTATISLSEDILELAKRLAAEDGRSLSNWLRRLIERNLAAESAKLADSAPAPSQATKRAAPRQPTTGEGSGSYRRSA